MIRKILISIFITAFVAIAARSQCTFENFYPYYPIVAPSIKIISTSDGGNITICAAYYDSLNPGGNSGQDIDMIVIKTDQCGNTLWRTHYGYPSEGDAGIDVIEAENGDYIVLGTAYWQQSAANPRVVRFSKNGQVIWSKLYSGQLTTLPHSMIKRKNKNSYVICGYTDHMLTPHDLYGGYLLEINDSGTVLKTKEILGIDSVFEIKNIFELNDTSYLMIANTIDSMYIFETDTSFNIRWIKNIFVKRLMNVSYYSSCLSYDQKSIAIVIDGVLIPPIPFTQYIPESGITCFNFQGDSINFKYFDHIADTLLTSWPYYITPTPQNGYITGGRILTTDKNLNIVNFQSYFLYSGLYIYSVALNKDMSLTASGLSYKNGELYILKIDSNGNYAHSGINETQLQNIDLTIYPNPTSNELHIQTTSNGKFGVQLFDVSCKQVISTILFTNNTTINTSSLNQGLYFVRITDANGAVVKTQKVAVCH